MNQYRNWIVVVLVLVALTGCFRRKKYENPITKDTQQPDKVLFDKAINDIERGRYEVARITLNTLINTYDTSEYLAKAKLAIADSWFREGGSSGLAQAEAEYKDFILFYPTLEESAEAQQKVCMIHYKQMEKPDRDPRHAIRAEEECRQLLVQFPNSKFAPGAQQLLRNIQEAIGEGEMRVGRFYHNKGSHVSSANRLNALVDQYPLFSAADEALWLMGDSYSRMGPRFRDKTIDSYTRIVRDYPLSDYTEEAKKKLQQLEAQIPEADPVALARMKYELENETRQGILGKAFGIFSKAPSTHAAAKSGSPAMTGLRPSLPATIPAATAGAATASEVTAGVLTDSTALDTKPDARQSLRPAQPPPAEAKKEEPKKEDKKAGSQEVKKSRSQEVEKVRRSERR